MAVAIVFALALFWQTFHLSTCTLAYLKYGNLKAVNWGLPLAGHRLNATPIATKNVADRMACMTQCVKTNGCVAINFGPEQAGEHECQLLNTTRYRLFQEIIVKPGWTYTGIKTECDTNPCADKRCIARETQNDYACLDLSKVATCQDYRDAGVTNSGVFPLTQPSGEKFEAYCDLEDEDGGWIVFARNDGKDADVFDQDWETYQNGFGNLNSNFWWGNEFLHLVTKDTPHELKVDLVKPGATDFTRCFQFQISDKNDGYRLSFNSASVSGYTGAKLHVNSGSKFSTPDKDLDGGSTVNCAAERGVGWWYNYCTYCVATRVPIHWGTWDPTFIQLKIRPMNV